MRRLIWKELREKWLLILALIASTLGLIILGDNYTLLNSANSGWIALSVFAALGLGAGAYSSELGGTADFARSRPISWKSMLAAKLVVGVVSVIVTVLLSVLVFCAKCPSQYHAFVNPVDLAPGVKAMFLIIGMSYLFGFTCSVIVPSIAGGIAVVFLVWFSCVVQVMLYKRANWVPVSGWSYTFRLVGLALAVALISRFGLTLTARWRAARFTAILLAFIVAGIPMDFTVRDAFTPRPTVEGWSLNPTGKYAGLMRNEPSIGADTGRGASYIVRIADGKKVEFPRAGPTITGPNTFWYKDTIAVCDANNIRIGRITAAGHLRTVNVRVEACNLNTDTRSSFTGVVLQSPGGRYLLVAPPDGSVDATLTVADLDQMRATHLAVAPKGVDCWWKSDSEIGYIDSTGRHIIRNAW